MWSESEEEVWKQDMAKKKKKPIYQTPFQRPIGWLEAGANMTQSLSWMPAAKLLYSSKRMCVRICVCVCVCVPASVCVSVWSCAVKCTDGWLIHQSCDSSITAVTILPPFWIFPFFSYSSSFHSHSCWFFSSCSFWLSVDLINSLCRFFVCILMQPWHIRASAVSKLVSPL